jgi:ribosomal protein S18 acetylase RimI-like enzyme
MKEFRFTNDNTRREASDVIGVLRSPRLWIPTEVDYPDYATWLLKVEAQIVSGEKRAMVARHGRQAVGAVVYGRHQTQPDAVEIKNISIVPEARGRYVGGFLVRNTEVEAVGNDFPGTSRVMVDTKTTNADMINFLNEQSYQVIDVTDLYGLGAGPDAVLEKPLS